jgi:hypothetical protein
VNPDFSRREGLLLYFTDEVDIFIPQHAGFDLSSTSTYTRMKLKKSGIPKNDDFVYSIP